MFFQNFLKIYFLQREATVKWLTAVTETLLTNPVSSKEI